MKQTTIAVIRVRASVLDRRIGRIEAGPAVVRCALGRSGLSRTKREGDGATPVGRFPVLGALFRADRGPRPRLRLPARPHRQADGWCDDPDDRRYNRPVSLPCDASHEKMWREDGVYDVVLDLAYNRGPIRRGRGSAIFLHLARAGFVPTEGCIAVAPAAMRRLAPRIGPRTVIAVIG